MLIRSLILAAIFSLSLTVNRPVFSAETESKPAGVLIGQNVQTEAVGRVVWVKGNFKAVSVTNQERVLEKASIIYLHDTLLTDASAQAQIVFTDNSLMTFKPNSRFVIENYIYDAKKKSGSAGKYVMSLIEGGFRTITGLIAKSDPDSYKVNTPVATIGVRGTDYAVYVKNGELYIGQYKGSPCVTSQTKEMCLNSNKPYATVPNANSAPQFLATQPAVFKQKLVVIPASIAPSSNGIGKLTSGAAATTETQVSAPTRSGIVSSFCIIN